ncbi:MAG: glycosyltransferase [bacterium]|nr:glycosyltransferase [bacterium]
MDRSLTAAHPVNQEAAIGIAIPAYRNPERLRRCLSSIADVDSRWLSLTTVVDDSGDGAVAAVLRSEFPQVKWIINDTNEGFIPSANLAVRESAAPIVLLLNDDVELRCDPRGRATELFQDPKLFALSLRSVDAAGKTREGAKRRVWRAGIARVLHAQKDQRPARDGCVESDYAVGGHALFRRSQFLELGGFDSLFQPFYWEDVDLSARAVARGWRVLYLADSEVFHNDLGAIRSTQDAASIRRTVWRNRLAFSFRHARGVQKFLLPFAIVFQRVAAALRADYMLSAAISDFLRSRRR